MSDEMRVENVKYRQIAKPPRQGGGWVWPVRPRSMIWLLIVGAVWLAATIYGTPHLRAQYTWNGRDSYPVYYKCWYWGLHSFDTLAFGGHCPLVLLARSTAGAR